MRTGARIGMLALALAVAAPAAVAPTPAVAQQAQGALHVRKWKHLVDGGGQVFLAMQFLNESTHSVTILGIAPTRVGPWVNVGRKFNSGDMHRILMKVTKDDPAQVWVDTTDGLMVFTPPVRR